MSRTNETERKIQHDMEEKIVCIICEKEERLTEEEICIDCTITHNLWNESREYDWVKEYFGEDEEIVELDEKN